MLRLRAYEKLQHLVSRNMVKKSGKKYKGLASLAHAIAPEEPLPPAVIFGAPAVVSAIKKLAPVKAPVAKVKAAKPAAKATKPSAKELPVKKVANKKAVVKAVAKKAPKKSSK
jgi:hypothetical protein